MERDDARVGISNRETASQEAQERIEHPPLVDDTDTSEVPAAPAGIEPIVGTENEQTSCKVGIRATARKTSESRYGDGTTPASRKVQGAFGKEPESPSEPE